MEAAGSYTPSSPDTWVEKYADILYSYALRRVSRPETAEELVQETFVSGLTSRQDFHGSATERTWLIGILRHKIMDHYRASYRHTTISPDKLDVLTEESLFDQRGNWISKPEKWRADPSHVYEQQEFMEVLNRCLEHLSSRAADAFRLREIVGADTEEICKVLAISPTNYWVLMHRARLRMRSCLEADWFALPEGVG